MVNKTLNFPEVAAAGKPGPTLERSEQFLKGGEKIDEDTFKLTIPTGKFARVIVKAIVHEITEEEYNKEMKALNPEAE